MNTFNIVGRVANKTSTDKATYLTVACKRTYKNKEGKYDTDFISVSFFSNQAEYVNKYVDKGDLVEVSGVLNVFTKEENGSKHSVLSAVGRNVSVLVKKNTDSTNAEAPAAPATPATPVAPAAPAAPVASATPVAPAVVATDEDNDDLPF